MTYYLKMLYLALCVKHVTPTGCFEFFIYCEINFVIFFPKEKSFGVNLFDPITLIHLYIIKQPTICYYCSCISDKTELVFKLIVGLQLSRSG